MKSESVGLRTRLYIGSPNSTHRLSVRYVKKIRSWATSVRLQGYTVYRATGYWEGKGEETAVIEVMGHRITKRNVQALRATLRQQAIVITTERVRSTVVS
jgi:hypothetical protein